MHQTEKTLKSALRQNRPYPPFSSLRHTAQKQLTNKKGRRESSKKRDAFYVPSANIFNNGMYSNCICLFVFGPEKCLLVFQ